jgi:glycosyltransferase involved in cell wall biosynthesis
MALQTVQALQNQGHIVTLYTFDHNPDCFSELQRGISIEIWRKKPGGKLISIITLAFHLRHFDIIIANNPPMQIVAALAKFFSWKKVQTIWWHHHVPWYLAPKTKIKSFFERNFIIPYIDQMVATSHFVAEKLREYCGRDSVVIHPVIQMKNEEWRMKNEQIDSDTVTLFTHGRLEAGKGLDMLTRVFDKIQSAEHKEQNAGNTQLIILWTGSLESKLREEGRDVRPFEGEKTFSELSTGKYGRVLGVYCSSIDAFGMASLESQMAGLSTVIMDSGGASEAILSDDHDEPVGYLVHTEEDLFRIISHYVQQKTFPKQLSNVNFSHKRDYFSPTRLSSDLLSLMSKTKQ